ncbi:MAG: hypothetical protein HY934_09790 [Candidatus Firestonebacteria bacterium]|nr:hypothetical protein [Candidatus Firestonebacteria bacterium]
MLDYLGIFQKFNKNDIKYAVVGGLAVNLYGIPRMTYDIDLILYLGNENLCNFLSIMQKWGFKPKIPVDILDFANSDKRKDWIVNKNMKAFNLVNPDWAISEIDIIIDTPIDYQKAVKNLKYVTIRDVSIPLISIYDLIIMKQSSNRLQDREDIKLLRKVINEK